MDSNSLLLIKVIRAVLVEDFEEKVNAFIESAEELGKLLKKMTCKMNLIPYNKVEEFGHEPPTKMEILLFKKRLSELGIHATVRMPRGRDVNAACGQLRHASK